MGVNGVTRKGRLKWKSKSANKGRKPCKGRVNRRSIGKSSK